MQTFDRATTAFQELIGTMRQQWANQLYPALHQQYHSQAAGRDITDSRAAVAANAGRLVPAVVGDSTVWMSAPVAARIADGLAPGPSHALPGFDEFMLGYKDRSIQAPAAHLDAIVPGGNGVFRSTVCLDGRAVATWTRTVRRARIDVTILPFAPLDGAQHAAAVDALQRYGDFLGLPIALA